MIKNHFRYQLYLKRSVLQAHISALDDTIYQIENHSDSPTHASLDYRQDEEECFKKYLSFIEGIK
jgi:hypothetical protein